MASTSTQTPRRIPGAPPNIFLEGAAFTFESPAPKPKEESNSKFKKKIRIKPRPQEESSSDSEVGPVQGPQPNPDPKGKGKQREEDVSITSIYGEDLPVFGRPYGFRETPRDEATSLGPAPLTPAPKKKPRTKTLNPYEDLLAEAEAEMDRYVEGGQPSNTPSNSQPNVMRSATDYFRKLGISPTQFEETPEEETIPPPFPRSSDSPKTCVVCMEDFTPKTQPPGWISLACAHEPTVCTPCIQQSIKMDLETKMWNKIQCPECGTLLIYEDIKRLADRITFSRYEILSFRSALSTDEDFIWCRNCNFGQLHSSGSTSPIVRCLNCNHATCFKHQVPWHSRMTCEEYDQMLADPDNFVPAVDKSNAEVEAAEKLQKDEDEKVAREWSHRERLAEQERQREKHKEERRKAKEAQLEVAKKNREEWERNEREKQMEDVKRRLKEDKASMEKVQTTTKRCPGCQWPIEKNEGCAHMTCTQCRHEFCWGCMGPWRGHGSYCIKCQHEFCWDCLAPYDAIRKFGNARHNRTCPYHSDNLPK